MINNLLDVYNTLLHEIEILFNFVVSQFWQVAQLFEVDPDIRLLYSFVQWRRRCTDLILQILNHKQSP